MRGEGDLDDLARTAGDAARQLTGLVAGVTFVALHAVAGWLVLSLAQVAPPWTVAVLTVVWAAVAMLGWRGRRRRPLITMLLPVAMAALVLGTLTLGDRVLGWTA